MGSRFDTLPRGHAGPVDRGNRIAKPSGVTTLGPAAPRPCWTSRSTGATDADGRADPFLLRPADPATVADTLSKALLYDGRRRVHDAGAVLAVTAARVLVEHLERDGFVALRNAKMVAPSTSGMPSPSG